MADPFIYLVGVGVRGAPEATVAMVAAPDDATQTLTAESYANLITGATEMELEAHEANMQDGVLSSPAQSADLSLGNGRKLAPKTKSGFLFKESKSRGKEHWKRCWFTYHGRSCDYHRKDASSDIAGSINLDDVLSCKMTNKRKRHFCFVLAVDNRGLFYLAADCYEEMVEWMLCFSKTKLYEEPEENASKQVIAKFQHENQRLLSDKESAVQEKNEAIQELNTVKGEMEKLQEEIAVLERDKRDTHDTMASIKFHHDEVREGGKRSSMCAIM